MEGLSTASKMEWPADVGVEQHAPWFHAHTAATAFLHDELESLAMLIHDVRNMVAALELYCDLLGDPGVLAECFHPYADELRMVARGSRRLLEKVAIIECRIDLQSHFASSAWLGKSRFVPRSTARPENGSARNSELNRDPDSTLSSSDRDEVFMTLADEGQPRVSTRRENRRKAQCLGKPIENMAEDLLANRNLLTALAGAGVTLGVSVVGGQRPIAITGEDLTRILVNLVMNSAEAMPSGGHIQIALAPAASAGTAHSNERLRLTVSDTGPGFPADVGGAIFEVGFSSYNSTGTRSEDNSWPIQHRGLGLSIVRSIVFAGGGSISAANRMVLDAEGEQRIVGAEIVMEFPVDRSDRQSPRHFGLSTLCFVDDAE